MQAIVQPSSVKGNIKAPASKSAMQRACAAALIRQGTTVLHNPGISADDTAALDIIRQLGAEVNHQEDTVTINGNGVKPVSQKIHCGESGLSARLFTSLASVSEKPLSVEGSGSLTRRPFSFFDEVLPQLDVTVSSAAGFLPLQVKGPLVPKNITVDGSLSSQFLTGLLFAYAASGAQDVTITVKDLNSKPYIDLTLSVLGSFGLKVPQNKNYEQFYYGKGEAATKQTDPLHFSVEGDWSGAAFLLVAGAISGDIFVQGLDVFSPQADRAVLQALMQAGAPMSIEPGQIHIRKGPLRAFHFNATDCPDLFPPLVALAAFCEGTTAIEGVHRLTHKESNRALTLQEEFGKLGIEVILQEDLMLVKGGQPKSAVVSSHHDHRIAMATAVAALRSEGPVTVQGAEAVNKSYPAFWAHLQQMGAAVTINNDNA